MQPSRWRFESKYIISMLLFVSNKISKKFIWTSIGRYSHKNFRWSYNCVNWPGPWHYNLERSPHSEVCVQFMLTRLGSTVLVVKMASSSKKPKLYHFHAEWETDYFFTRVKDKCVWLLCNGSASDEKKGNVERHFKLRMELLQW